MSEKTVLVIDDSTTIRRLCDSELSGAGYNVLLAPTAEDGVRMATEQNPDLIILDHQLPGTTGYEVCCQLLADPKTAMIPVIASSTLRKKAYGEYLECDNVVDMLPKPYTPEALIATVENSINTAEMVVQSQCDGLSVPEVIGEVGEADMAGTFDVFAIREIVDMLNNGLKSGVLEVESERCRVSIYLHSGRLQAVTASGVDPGEVAKYMPDALSELSPVIKLTVAGRNGTAVDGLVELLNNKVLDPRLLKKLLRLQAAVLLRLCFTGKPKSFRFDHQQILPALFQKLPLECSLLASLVEGAMICGQADLPVLLPDTGFVRKSMRGQNLDRAGLSSRYMKLLSVVAEPTSVDEVSRRLGWSTEEAHRVLNAFELADLVEQCNISTKATKVYAVAKNEALRSNIESLFETQADMIGKVVAEWMPLRLLLRRQKPDVLLVELDAANQKQLDQLLSHPNAPLAGVKIVGIRSVNSESLNLDAALNVKRMLPVDCDEATLLAEIESLRACTAVAIVDSANAKVDKEESTKSVANVEAMIESLIQKETANEPTNLPLDLSNTPVESTTEPNADEFSIPTF